MTYKERLKCTHTHKHKHVHLGIHPIHPRVNMYRTIVHMYTLVKMHINMHTRVDAYVCAYRHMYLLVHMRIST